MTDRQNDETPKENDLFKSLNDWKTISFVVEHDSQIVGYSQKFLRSSYDDIFILAPKPQKY